MSASIFNNKLAEPNDKLLAHELDKAMVYFENIVAFIRENYDDLKFEWKYYGQKSGWILKLINFNRNILFIIPCKGYFKASFTFGDKAVNELINSNLPDRIKNELNDAKKYAEGRSIQIDVGSLEQIGILQLLIKAKMNS